MFKLQSWCWWLQGRVSAEGALSNLGLITLVVPVWTCWWCRAALPALLPLSQFYLLPYLITCCSLIFSRSVAFSPTELSSRSVRVSACGCSVLLTLSSRGRWRVLPAGTRRSGQDLWLWQEGVALLLCFSKRMILQIAAFLFWTKLLIILQNIPKLCFISSKCHIPVLPESTDDLCSSQGTIENNMLIKDNENLYPDRIFSVKINAGLMLSAIQLLG